MSFRQRLLLFTDWPDVGGRDDQLTIVVEASANLVNWQPIWTNTLSGASADFVDPECLQHPNRFYRARSD